jgi:RND family efflux transporter MFP subunit
MRHSSSLHRWAATAAAVIAISAMVAPLAAQERAARVKVDVVREEPLNQTIPILGRLVAREQGEVAAGVAGPVSQVYAQVGDRVAKGDVMAELVVDMRLALIAQRESDLAMRRAQVTSANAQLELSRDEMRRLEKLKNSSAFPRARYEDQQHEVVRFTSAQAEARASLGRTEAELSMARIELERARIRAPYDGVVTRRHVSPGAFVRLGDPIVTLLNDRGLELEADVPAERLGGLSPGSIVDALLDDGTPIAATVRALIPDENPLTRTRQVRFSADLGNGINRAVNQSVMVHVPVGKKRNVLSVHKDAVITRNGAQLVYVVEEGKASIRPVKLGEAVGTRFEILDGLAPGDQVVVRGNERLRPGQAVTVAKS